MTPKSNHRWDGKTGGRLAMEVLLASLPKLNPTASLHECITLFSEVLKKEYLSRGIMDLMISDPPARWTASFVIYSHLKKEIWMVGDCICMVDDMFISHEKEIDAIMANARAVMLESELLKGKTLEDFYEKDPGREMIMPLLKNEKYFQNSTKAQFAYEAIDGFPVREDLAKIIPIPNGTEMIILASDGYPKLFSSLEETESYLQTVLQQDPLCFREFKSTKGIQTHQSSYDDRSYIKFSIKN